MVEPESEPPAAIARQLVGARIVGGVEVSTINHADVAIPMGEAVLVIKPPSRFNVYGKTFADVLGQHYAFTVADPAEGGFRQSPDDLCRVLDMVGSA
ncbi:MAG TPA: hypothetical protein PK264_07190 [Hyphomicrobiaceae bacterium]|nr:hypothetical protein [Hyphomicrobiaceae bacterium]